jgi:two-component system, NtrC family, nitrogen regulation response regulator NtrX
MAQILVVDDEPSILTTLQTHLSLGGHTVHTRSKIAGARDVVASTPLDLVLLDAYLGSERGLDFLVEVRASHPSLPIVMISGQSEMADVVAALKAGAFDFLEKPLDPQRIAVLVAHCLRQEKLRSEVDDLRASWKRDHFFAGTSPAAQKALTLVEKVAPTEMTVLLTGPNGSGKEPLAYLTYLYSQRLGRPWVTANCAAIPAALFESTLLGHSKGAFTGAVEAKKGLFVQADGGTLFLDEIGELTLEVQSKLLRVLETKEVVAVGAESGRKVDFRLIVATNRNLEKEVAEGRFREDLFYRLCQMVIPVPALKERREDLPGLAAHFLAQIDARRGSSGARLNADALVWLQRQDFPGNIRQLRNWIERAALLAEGPELGPADFEGAPGSRVETAPPPPEGFDGLFELESLIEARRAFEQTFLKRRLARFDGSVKLTAESLGLLPNNLSRRLSELGL